MSVGTTDTWSQSRDEIISDALANVGVIGPGVDASGSAVQGRLKDFAARALNRLVKSLDAEGQFLWRISRLTVSGNTISGTASYALSARAFDVDAPMTYKAAAGTSRTDIWPMSRDDYMAIPDRTITGTPNRYYLEKAITGAGISQITAYFWPTPSVTGDVVEYPAFLRGLDYNTGATNSDFPTNWIRCLVYGLTAEIAPAFSQAQLSGQYWDMFEAEKNKQLGSDNEKQGVTFVPFGGFGSGNYG